MKKITKKEVLSFFYNLKNKKILFKSYFNCNHIDKKILISDTSIFGYTKQNLQIEEKSTYILLNGSRLDLKSKKFYLIEDALIVEDEADQNIIIYIEKK